MARDLTDIPNISGYKLIGITHDDLEIECEVRVGRDGCHEVFDASGNPVYFDLTGWREVRDVV